MKNYIPIFLIILAVIIAIFSIKTPKSSIFISNNDNKNTSQIDKTTIAKNIPDNKNDTITIPINPPTELSYKLKENIYNLRKYYVKNSIFNTDNYEPSEAVFGNIVSGKPWIANDICKNWQTKATKIDGPSEEARFINNPAILVAIEYPFTFSNYEDPSWCKDPISTITPKSLTYNKSTKEITVTYEKLPFSTLGNKSFYTFNGLNAKDLGYKYAYIDKSKSTYDIDFSNEYNISSDIIEFQNFIHLGGSCNVPGGCNNGSPRQSYLEFKNEKSGNYETKNEIIYIKLWKHSPSSKDAKADITEKIILEKT